MGPLTLDKENLIGFSVRTCRLDRPLPYWEMVATRTSALDA